MFSTGGTLFFVSAAPHFEVWENSNVKVFDKPRHFTDRKHFNYFPWIHTGVAKFIVCMIFLMYIATTQHLNCIRQSKQESKKHNLQFIFLKHLWTWSKFKVVKPTIDLDRGYKYSKFERFHFNSVREKATLKFFMWNLSVISLEHVQKVKNSGIFKICVK